MLRSSYESVPEQLVSVPEQLLSLPEQLLVFRSSYKSSGTVISLPEQLVSAPEQLGYAEFLHTMTPIRFHNIARLKWIDAAFRQMFIGALVASYVWMTHHVFLHVAFHTHWLLGNNCFLPGTPQDRKMTGDRDLQLLVIIHPATETRISSTVNSLHRTLMLKLPWIKDNSHKND